MEYQFYMPVRVIGGENCVVNNAALLRSFGKRALIVSGKSAFYNGAFDDVKSALSKNGQAYAVFDGVTPNPTVACVREGICVLKNSGADFIVAIGGGSPMDAAKAIAILAKEERSDEEIFKGGYGNDAYPMVHIPTTAGTGSEVTPYSIITNDLSQTKTSIASPALFPAIAFLDAKYMQTLSRATTVNTAIDALSHAIESLLSNLSTPSSEWAAEESLRRMAKVKSALLLGEFTQADREEMLYSSCLAGVAIAQTGTTIVHSMGYALTYFYNVDHGRANGLLLGETLRLSQKRVPERMQKICSALGMRDAEELVKFFDSLLGKREEISDLELCDFTVKLRGNKNLVKCSYAPTEAEILEIYRKSCGERRG